MQQNKQSVFLLSKTSWLMILALSASSALTAQQQAERFAPVSVVIGQGVRVLVANVRVPDAGAPTDACPVVVRFFAADGTPIGADQNVSLSPGASISVAAASISVPASLAAVVRAIVSLAGSSDPGSLCALKSGVEVFDIRTSATMFIVPGKSCLGAAACSTPLGQ